eukprot:g5317.t1
MSRFLVSFSALFVISIIQLSSTFEVGGFQRDDVDRSAAQTPNVLILLIDDMGYGDLEAFGSPNVSTPKIDALISRGMKMKHFVSAAPICTPSRAALQTGRYPARTGCIGNVEQYRVLPTPSSPHGLDPKEHISIAKALKGVGYKTGMSGKWHLGINGNGALEKQDFRFHPNAHGYDTYLGAPYTNAPMCAMDGDGISDKFASGQTYCFLMANETVVQQPLRLENFTRTITDHAVRFIDGQSVLQPWFFFMSYFHVHTPLFTERSNVGRSSGGRFGDNVEELDDSIGRITATLDERNFTDNTLIFLLSDNGPYAEEGWDRSGRTNVYDETSGKLLGRLKGSKGQIFEGGIRMPAAVIWPSIVPQGSSSDVMVSTMDIFPTVCSVAGVRLGGNYTVDGRSMLPIVTENGAAAVSQHNVLFHYCGFQILAARVGGRFKVFWGTQKWYTNDPMNASVCTECCNGANPWSKPVTGTVATELCGCEDKDIEWVSKDIDLPVYDMLLDPFERDPLNSSSKWPSIDPSRTSIASYSSVITTANIARKNMIDRFDPKPNRQGAGALCGGRGL